MLTLWRGKWNLLDMHLSVACQFISMTNVVNLTNSMGVSVHCLPIEKIIWSPICMKIGHTHKNRQTHDKNHNLSM